MIELRDIEIFLALAEELHFGRTAERLHITPGRVSQSIARQERRIGGALFERTTRTVRLTALGQQLHQQLSAGYQQIMAGIDAATTATGGVGGTLTIGAMGAQPWKVSHIIDLFKARHPAVRLRYREIHPTAPLQKVRAGEVDVALVWLPVREPDLTVGPVTHTSQVMLMVGAQHPLADRESICLEDMGDCVVLAGTDVPTAMEETFNPLRTPSGRPVRRGPTVSDWHEEMSVVAAGEAVTGVAGDAARFYPWPNIVYLPIRDAPSCRWAFVWRTVSETAVIRALAQAATDAAPTVERDL
ncbi:LysR family transcriptional regulator [Plantactinospora endophytica]|uniref:LysR family transcriptional regulator n=1 Tax=Plantactinospora endophytica TaxID=673535 RepID=A0ABQ4E0U7_9ACTN|nr:LysR family transcriptional regulator [Plantactinospora endophytica]GIG88290.1 LysR family transcriptional regulator [Plantactinospora endophytica]